MDHLWGLQRKKKPGPNPYPPLHILGLNSQQSTGVRRHWITVYGQFLALHVHCVHTAHAKAEILTQEYLSPV